MGSGPLQRGDGTVGGESCPFDEIDKDTCGLVFIYNDQYGQQCSLSYVRENLRRLYFFVAAVGAGFAAISMTWAGVVYMQESSSGMDLTRARGMMIRVLIGLVVLASALMGWEGVNDLLLLHVESWDPRTGVRTTGWNRVVTLVRGPWVGCAMFWQDLFRGVGGQIECENPFCGSF